MSKMVKTYFHIVMVLVLMTGIGMLPAVEPITPFGMKILGIFVGMLYGWTFCSMIWVSFLGMLMLCLTGAYTMKEFMAISFGSETVMFIMLMFVFTALLEHFGLTKFIANWFISRKLVEGRPWLFSFILFVGAFFAGGFINMIASMMVFWGVIYVVSDKFGFKPYEKYPTLMILGIGIASCVGGAVPPYKMVPMVLLTAYGNVTGQSVTFFDYICFSLPVALLVVVVYTLTCRFVFRPDMKELKNLRADLVDPADLVLDRDKKVVLGFFVAFLFLILAPGFLPQEWLFSRVLNQLGIVGIVITLIVLASWIFSASEKKPMLDFSKMAAQGISWDVVIIMAIIMPFTSILTSDATGIKEFLSEVLAPFLSTMSPLAFMIVGLLIATALTNFANNMVIGVIFVSVFLSVSEMMGLDALPIIVTLIICCNMAFVTPAASPIAAFVFANYQWVKTTDIYKYAGIFICIALIVVIMAGLLWANVIF